MSNGGSVLQWFRSHFYGDDATYDDILAELAQVPAGAEGVVALPYLRGRGSPSTIRRHGRACSGLGFEHGRAHVGRALLEGVAFGILSVKEIFSEMGIDVRRIVVTGGASRSVLWNQIKADVLGQEVYTPAEPESGILGAAIIARAGVENKPIGAVARGMITLKECTVPTRIHSLYQQLYMRYLSL